MKVLALLLGLCMTGCATGAYQKMYADYLNVVKSATAKELCSLKAPKGGQLPEGFEFNCYMPQSSASIQPPQMPVEYGWKVLEKVIDRGASVATFGIGASVVRSIVNKAVDGAGHNITDSYNTDSHDITGSYNTDRHDVNDSYNDRHDINDSYNDRHDVNDSYNDRHDINNSYTD